MLIGASWCNLVRNDDNYYLQWLFAVNHKILWAGGCHTFRTETPYREKSVFFLPTTNVSDSLAGIKKNLYHSLWVLLEARQPYAWVWVAAEGQEHCVWTAGADAKLQSGAAEAPKIYDVSFSFRCLEMPADPGRLGPGSHLGVGQT